MKARVFSRIRLWTLLKFRRCTEEWLGREWTRWKPHTKTHQRTAPGRPPTIQETLCNTASSKSRAVVRGRAVKSREEKTPGTIALRGGQAHADGRPRIEKGNSRRLFYIEKGR